MVETTADAASGPGRPVGRPRDPGVDERILTTALGVFAAAGWSGLTMEAVASGARTGKTSLYMRWQSKRDLLKAALRWATTSSEPAGDPGQPVRDRLVAIVRSRAALLLGPYGIALLRYEVESRALPDEFADIRAEVTTAPVLTMRHWLEHAIASGDLATDKTAVQLLEAIEGSVLAHVLVTPPALVPRVLEALPRWSEQLVDSQIGPAAPALGPHA